MGEKNEPYEASQLVKQEELRTITASTSGQSYLGHAWAQPRAERRTSHGGCFALDLTIVGLMCGRRQAKVQTHERT
jgi:hypothetical protein